MTMPYLGFFSHETLCMHLTERSQFFFASDLSFFWFLPSSLLCYFRVFISSQPFYPKSVPACSTILVQLHRDGAMFFQRLFIPPKAKRFFTSLPPNIPNT
ncbi:hypothetical protein TWF281_006500 [Arthrobotrys megalospora]